MTDKDTALDLEGKVAIVTGSARGIGRAIALGLARRGADVVITDVEEELAKQTAREVTALGRRSLAIRCDVGSREEVEGLIKQVVAELGQLNIYVNNAGITRDTLLIRMSEEQWSQVMDINLKGTFFGTKAAAKVMMKARTGRIVNVASVVGRMGNVGQANYSASKAGVIALTRTAARELAPRNITVNAVAPGYIETEMTKGLPEKARAAFLERIPLGRPGSADDVANTVCFLCSPAADYITGQCITIDGGMTTF